MTNLASNSGFTMAMDELYPDEDLLTAARRLAAQRGIRLRWPIYIR